MLVVAIGVAGMMLEWYKGEMNNQMVQAGKGGVQIGGPFTLTDHNGKTVTEQDFKDKPSLLFFGYTFCPDVCPTTLAEMTLWVEDLGDDAKKLNYIFVSVDPGRDTPESMKEYVSVFFDGLTGLTGTREQIDAVAKAFRVYAKRAEDEDGDTETYVLDHTASVYLMKKNNVFTGTISYGEEHESAVGKIRKLLASS